MNKIVVIVLDGFGIGSMEDTKDVRPQDNGSNTLKSILRNYPDLKLENLEKLGLMNAAGFESENMKFQEDANFGKNNLMHFGADTFMGHQEIMGTLPRKPLFRGFQKDLDDVKKHLEENGHKVEIKTTNGLSYLVCDDYVTIADNLEADLGMVYNVTAPLDYISFEKEVEIGKLVREVVKVARVIVFGGRGNNMEDIFNAERIKEGKYIGIDSTESKSYEKDYHCIHLGYGVDEEVQVPYILNRENIPVTLIGKVADIVYNEDLSIPCVPTVECLNHTIEEYMKMDKGFICTNVQETDLSGHAQNPGRYREVLLEADKGIGELLKKFDNSDILIVIADHGNDPEIGHSKHTREQTPLLVYKKGVKGVNLGTRDTLSDVGASVCDFFGVKSPENGESFINLIK